MYFSTQMSSSVSEGDHDLLYLTTLIMNCLEKSAHQVQNNTTYKKWHLPPINCHSASRLVSLFAEELTLVDGFLLGLRANDDDTLMLQQTQHSWLVTPDKAIIDPWPMGIISPGNAILIPTVENDFVAHGSNLYYEDSSVREAFDSRKSWESAFTFKRILGTHTSSKEKIDEVTKLIEDLF